MIDKYEKIKCNGCKMCKDLCKQGAITYEVDGEGFWYPKVNYDLCVSCGACVNKCPNLTPIRKRTKEPRVFAAWSKSDDIRLASTSGGIFYELAQSVLNRSGAVVGCIYNDDFKGAKQVIVTSKDNLAPLMVSKYVQSDTEGIFKATKDFLMQDKEVLFVGAPCHCAALVSYLGKEYENLVICDFLCRGANSPKAHRKYVEYLENRYGARIVSLRSKDKRNGWNHFGQSATFENGAQYYAGREEDLRIVAYHHGNLMMRESCHQCQFKHIPRDGADITLADFWSIDPKDVIDIEKGISLVMINSDRGYIAFESIENQIHYIERNLEDALKGNVAIFKSAPRGKNRDVFLSRLDEEPFDKLVNQYRDREPNLIAKVARRAKRLINGFKV